MKIQRTIPPTAAPLSWGDLWNGIASFMGKTAALRELESELKAHFGVKHLFLVSSGKAALYLILQGLKKLYPERNEVVIPAYTCYSVPSAIVKAGLKVTPCDIDPNTLDLNRDQLEKTLNPRTLCVVPGHLFGIPSDIRSIQILCERTGIPVVEDAAQGMGGTDQGKKLGTVGTVGFFSLGRGKNITCGSGGIIVTQRDEIAGAIQEDYVLLPSPTRGQDLLEWIKLALLVFFIPPGRYWFPSGIPSLRLGETFFYKDFPVEKLSKMKAGILRNWKDRLDDSNRNRRENARYWIEKSGFPPPSRRSENAALLRFPLLVKDREMRDALFVRSRARGLGLSRMYPAPVNEIAEIREEMGGWVFPGAKTVADRLLNLPTHPLLTRKDRDGISELLRETTLS